VELKDHAILVSLHGTFYAILCSDAEHPISHEMPSIISYDGRLFVKHMSTGLAIATGLPVYWETDSVEPPLEAIKPVARGDIEARLAKAESHNAPDD
jgi:hypothetical protein